MMTLREYLDATGETQQAFAARIGAHQGTISKLCGGPDRPPSLPGWSMAARIERATEGKVPVAVWAAVHADGNVDAPTPLQGEREGNAA
jgi:DNA-binding transcriptional regulator YdaS (Cro superfamily)